MGWSGVFIIVEVSVQVSVETALGRIGCLDLRYGLVLNDFLGRVSFPKSSSVS